METIQEVIYGDCVTEMQLLYNKGIRFDCIVSSPPYWGMKTYKTEEPTFIGMEKSVDDYLSSLGEAYYWCYKILHQKGLFFLNVDSGKRVNREQIVPAWEHYNLCVHPEYSSRNKFKLSMTLIWYDPAKTPIVSPRILKHNYEPIFVFFKDKDYNFYKDEIRVPYSRFYADPATGKDPDAWGCDKYKQWKLHPKGADRGDVWKIHHPRGCHGRRGIDRDLHCAPFPEELIEVILKCATKEGDWVLDPFSGAGTVGVVCKRLNRNFLGIEIIKKYCDLANKRIQETKI